LGGDNKNRPKRRVWRRLGHHTFFSFYYYTNLLFNVYIGSLYILYGPGGLRWAAITKTGPNDVSGVVWAIVRFFLFLIILTYFLMSI
jgi:hypothetical protein